LAFFDRIDLKLNKIGDFSQQDFMPSMNDGAFLEATNFVDYSFGQSEYAIIPGGQGHASGSVIKIITGNANVLPTKFKYKFSMPYAGIVWVACRLKKSGNSPRCSFSIAPPDDPFGFMESMPSMSGDEIWYQRRLAPIIKQEEEFYLNIGYDNPGGDVVVINGGSLVGDLEIDCIYFGYEPIITAGVFATSISEHWWNVDTTSSVSPYRLSVIKSKTIYKYSTINLVSLGIDGAYQSGMGSWCSLNDARVDGWRQFMIKDCAPSLSRGPNDFSFIVPLVSPAAASSEFLWEKSSTENIIANAEVIEPGTPFGESVQFHSSLAVRCYARRDFVENGKITTPAPVEQAVQVVYLDEASLGGKIDNASYFETEYGTGVKLSLPQRIVGLIVDQSGSMSWSDPDNVRFSVAREIMDRFAGGYPGDVSFAISSFSGVPVNVEWFASRERDLDDAGSAQSAQASFSKSGSHNFAGVQIVRKKESAPLSPSDGDVVFDGYTSVFYDTNLDPLSTYYYSIYPKDSYGRTYTPKVISISPDGDKFPPGLKSIVGKEYKGTGVGISENTLASWHMNEGYGSKCYSFTSNASYLEMQASSTILSSWLEINESPTPSEEEQFGKGSGIRLNGTDQYLTHTAAIPHDGDVLSFTCWINPLKGAVGIIGGVIASWRWGTSQIILRCSSTGIISLQIESQSFQSDDAIIGGSWNSVFVSISGINGNIKIYTNGESKEFSSLWRRTGSNITNFRVGRFQNQFGAFKVTEVGLYGELLSNEFIASNYKYINPDNGDRILVISNPDGQLIGYSGNRLILKYKREAGPLRLLDQNISGPANVGKYGGDSSRPQNVPIPPGLNGIARSDVSARICYGDDLGPVDPEDGLTLYDSNNGILNEVVFHGPFSLPMRDSELGNIVYDGYRHYIRAFSINEADEHSVVEDSGMIEYHPSSMGDYLPVSIPPDVVSNVNYIAGDKKIRLTWDLPVNSDHDTVVVYYAKPFSQDGALTYTDLDSFINSNTHSGAYPVFCGISTATEFTHYYGRVSASTPIGSDAVDAIQTFNLNRDLSTELENGKLAHYAVVLRNADGKYGQPIFISSIPDPETDNQIPTEPPLAQRAYKLERGSIAIKLINPVNPKMFYDVDGWFDDRVFFYFKVSDIYGRPLEDEFDFVFRTNYDISSNAGDYYDVPSNLMITDRGTADGVYDSVDSYKSFDPLTGVPARLNFKFRELCRFTRRTSADGFVKIVLDTDAFGAEKLRYVSGLYFSARMSIRRKRIVNSLVSGIAEESSTFAFDTQPIRVWLSNPFKIEVTSPDKTIVPCLPGSNVANINNFYDCGAGSSSDLTTAVYNGAYVGRSRPIQFTFRVKYKDGFMPSGSAANLYAFEDSLPSWSSDGLMNRCSKPAGYRGCVQFNGENGTPRETKCTGQIAGDPVFGPDFTREYVPANYISPRQRTAIFYNNEENGWSEASFYFPTPSRSSAATVFAQTVIGGLPAAAGMYFAFPDPLFLSLDAQVPSPDGVDVARQTAYAAIIDPNRAIVIGDVEGATVSSLEEFSSPVPDGTRIDWEMIPLRNGKNRPFYSLASSNSAQVYDLTLGGYSSNVRFGPASNVTSELIQEVTYFTSADGNTGSDVRVVLVPEMYVIKASVTYGGKTITAWKVVCIYPPALVPSGLGNSANQLVRRTGMFCSLTNGRYSQRIYADGDDFAVFQISRDARISSIDSSSADERTMATAFLKCYNGGSFAGQGMPDAFISILAPEQLVEIQIGKLQDYLEQANVPYWVYNVEILHDNIAIVSNGDGTSSITYGRSDLNNAFVRLSNQNKTYFAIRSNGFIAKRWNRHNEPTTVKDSGYLCEHFHNRPFAATGELIGASGNEQPVFSNTENCSTDGFVEDCNYDSRIITETEDKRWLDYDVVVNAQTNIDTSLGEIPCIGSGTWALGNPPKLIKFIEPLDITFAFVEVGGVRNFDGNVLVDGVSQNDIYFAVSFSGRPVPQGTEILVYTCGSPSIAVVENNISTATVDENGPWCVDADGNFINAGTSYAVVRLLPMMPGSSFSGSVFAEARYNKNGTVFRQKVCGVNITYDGASEGAAVQFVLPPGGGGESGDNAALPTILKDPVSGRDFSRLSISNQCFFFDRTTLTWSQVADMAVARAWHVSECVNSKWYVVGGLSQYGISTMNEVWDIPNNRWDVIPDMPTPRFGCCSVNDGRYIYVIGGVESYVDAYSNPSASKVKYSLRASNKIECFDTVDGTWAVLSSMPWTDSDGNIVDAPVGNFDSASSGISPLSSVFGSAVLVAQKIYVLCGARAINSELEPSVMLDRVLIFDQESNSWSVSDVLPDRDLVRYARLYPNAIVKNNNILIFGGSGYREETEQYFLNNEIISRSIIKQFNFKDAILIDTLLVNTPSYLFDADELMPNPPESRDQAGQARFNNSYAILGGRKFSSSTNPGSPALSTVQNIDISSAKAILGNLAVMPFGRALCSFASDNSRFAVLSGGVSSGKAPGFVRVFIEVYGEQNDTVGFTRLDLQEPVDAMVRLDGISGVDIKIKCYDENGKLLSRNTQVKLTGFIKFPIPDELGVGGSLGSTFGRSGPGGDVLFMKKRVRRGTRVFPVRISPEVVDIAAGLGSAKLLGRSEDPLRDISELSAALGDTLGAEIDLAGTMSNQILLRQGLSRFPYQIVLYGEIVDDSFYGNTSFVGEDDFIEGSSYPELTAQDEIANQGDFDFASPLPEFSLGYGGLNSSNADIVPLPFVNLGNVLETSQLGVIGPIGDSDIFTFTAPVTGQYVVSVTRRNVSSLQSQITIYNSNFVPIDIPEIPDGIIYFNNDDGIGDPTNNIFLESGLKYYIVVKASNAELNPTSDIIGSVVGEYRLRLAVPFEDANNLAIMQNVNLGGGNFAPNLNLGGNATCQFTCPSCLRTGSGLSGLTCTGTNNTICFNLIGKSSFNLNDGQNAQNQNLNLNGEGGEVNLGSPQPPTGKPELLDFIFIDMNAVFSYWSGGATELVEPDSPLIQYYSDLSWLPQVRTRTFSGASAYQNAQEEIEILSRMTPFGCSPIFNAIRENAFSVPESVDTETAKRSFILISDNDENTSSVGAEDVAADLNSIAGSRKSPLMVALMNLVEPRFISSALSKSNAGEVIVASSMSGGATSIIRNASDASKFVNFAMSRSVGAIARGTYESVIDLGRDCVVLSINPVFEIPPDTSADYSVEFSSDGISYSMRDSSSYENPIIGPAKIVRFIKIKVNLIHSLLNVARDENGMPSPEYPALLKIDLSVSFSAESSIITKPFAVGGAPNQVVLSVYADKNELAYIETTAAAGTGYDFSDYAVKYHGVVREYGKIIFSQRKFEVPEQIREKMVQVHGLYYESPRGGWFMNSTVTVKDGTGSIIDPTAYILLPEKGAILFKSYVQNPIFIEVVNPEQLSLAANVINVSKDEAVGISGISFMTTTEKEAYGYTANQPPVAVNLSISSPPITIYETITCNYTYLDAEGDEEDSSKTEIRWFINDIEIPFLKNKKTFNNFSDPQDPVFAYALSTNYAFLGAQQGQPGALLAALDAVSFLKINDRVRFSVKPHDQTQYGLEAFSQQITVTNIEDTPSQPALKARLLTTQEIVEDASNQTSLFIDFPLFSPVLMNRTIVRWYITLPNQQEFRFRELSLIGDPSDPSTVLRPGTVNGLRAIAVGNIIRAELYIPASSTNQEYTLSTMSMVIRNSRPRVELLIFGLEATGQETDSGDFWIARCRYAFIDADIISGEAQEDQSLAYWEVQYPETEDFVVVEGLDPRFDGWNVVDVPYNSKIRVRVLPYDGVEFAPAAYSNVILKQGSFDGNAGGGGGNGPG